MEIPIQNIYYLLCYSWDKLEEKDIVNIDSTDSPEILDLLCKVLTNGTTHLLKRGVDRSYVTWKEDTTSIRGRIDFNQSIKRNLMRRAILRCEFDELDYNILHNQILKATFKNLLKNKNIDKDLKEEMKGVYTYFSSIDDIYLSERSFGSVRLNRNNGFYDFLLKVCILIYDNLLMNEDTGESKFRDFLRDENTMQHLFENFVRNFYRREQKLYTVKSENIRWDARCLTEASDGFLPKMTTDISLESPKRKIIIDTKYYKDAFQNNYNVEKLHSVNLYQIFSYLKNVEAKGGMNRHCEGILLYPTVSKELDLRYKIAGHKLSIKTINLNQDWKKIHNDLIEMTIAY